MNAYIKLINDYHVASVCDTNGGRYLINLDNNFLEVLGGYRYDYIFVWDAHEIFAIIDAYALNNNLLDYETLPRNSLGYKPRITSECISRRDSDGAFFERKLWIKTKKINSIDRHKRLSASTYINVHNFFGSITFEEACKAFEVNERYTEDESGFKLFMLMDNFGDAINSITGIKLFNAYGKLMFWTMGGISKSYYLKIFERNKGVSYSNYVPQNEEFEIEMRLTHLLSKGILYCKKFNRKFCNYIKYDKNSLFSHVGQHCPIFYPPQNCTWQDYLKGRQDRSGRTAYIITFNRLLLKVKNPYPNVLQPHGEKCTDINPPILDYKAQSFFGEHFETLLKIYDIIDIDIKSVYKLHTERDPVILEFTQHLFGLKKSLNGNSARRAVVKYLLNNLHGKYAQICLIPNFEYNSDNNGILTRRIKSLKNAWAKSHFDYIRGAYIYSMAQREMLEELIKLPRPTEVAYIDTDCFITQVTNAPRNVGDNLGEFKKEDIYNEVIFYAPKTYIGYDRNFELKVTCAGLNSSEIKSYLLQEKQKGFPIEISKLKSKMLPTTFTRRTRDGFERVREWRVIGDGLTDTQIRERGYINATDE